MSTLRNAIPRRAHKERSQPHSRRKFGLLEKHKDYVVRAQAFHKKEETIRKLKEKAANRNPDEFYFKMINSKTVDGVHRRKTDVQKYSQEELMLMRTQDSGYVRQKIQSEKKKIERLSSTLHKLNDQAPNKHIYYAEDRAEAKAIISRSQQIIQVPASQDVPKRIKRKTNASYRELDARKKRVHELENLHSTMSLEKELQKPGRKRKLRPDEIVSPDEDKESSAMKPIYKWRAERKR